MFILSPARLSLHFKVNSRLSSFRFRIELHSMPLQISENSRWRVKLKADLISSLHHRKPPWRDVWMMKKKLYPTCCNLNATLTMLKLKRKSCSFHMYRWEQRWVIIAVCSSYGDTSRSLSPRETSLPFCFTERASCAQATLEVSFPVCHLEPMKLLENKASKATSKCTTGTWIIVTLRNNCARSNLTLWARWIGTNWVSVDGI